MTDSVQLKLRQRATIIAHINAASRPTQFLIASGSIIDRTYFDNLKPLLSADLAETIAVQFGSIR